MSLRSSKYAIETGARFEKLVVLELVDAPGKAVYMTICDCGTLRKAGAYELRQGRATSCGGVGCSKSTLHGLSRTPEYKCWASMKSRCLNPKNIKFHCYGARGIAICKRWMDFTIFLKDMGRQPSKKCNTIDRINNNGNYEPGNCRWASRKEQSNNTSQNIMLELNGVKRNITQWSDTLGWSAGAIYARLRKGWNVERTLTQKLRGAA